MAPDIVREERRAKQTILEMFIGNRQTVFFVCCHYKINECLQYRVAVFRQKEGELRQALIISTLRHLFSKGPTGNRKQAAVAQSQSHPPLIK